MVNSNPLVELKTDENVTFDGDAFIGGVINEKTQGRQKNQSKFPVNDNTCGSSIGFFFQNSMKNPIW